MTELDTMLPKTLSAWLLPAVAIVAAATEFQPQGYVPRPLNDTIEALGLEEMVKDLPNFEDEKRDLSTRCSVAVCLAPCWWKRFYLFSEQSSSDRLIYYLILESSVICSAICTRLVSRCQEPARILRIRRATGPSNNPYCRPLASLQ